MLRTKIQWLIALIISIMVTAYFHNGKKINGVIWSDQEGYYIYLPALFIDGFDKATCINGCRTVDTPDGPRIFTKYTYGVALLESPFFLVAHVASKLSSYPSDGRSLPYIWAVMLAAIFYMLAGISLISKLLSELNYSRPIQWAVPLLILLGTNLFYYTFREAGMSHVYSFFLISLLCYASFKKTKSTALVWVVLTAVPLALLVLIRPTNAVAVLIPMFWGAKPSEILHRIRLFILEWRWILVFGLAFAALILPQILYWKMVTGNYVVYSYGDEGFTYWNRPKMLQVLFSHQNGWLTYSPVMLFPLAGLFGMIRSKQYNWLLPTIMLVIITYIFGSWWAWWFGGAYGHRCYVDFLPVFAIPFGYVIQRMENWTTLMKVGTGGIFLILVFINIRMSDFYMGMWDGPDWTWLSYIEKLRQVFYIN
ncbi:MAG: hypothetical protein H6601_00200 [Flavobacteriales bacterium]|nr:hypothetical protein [Flavobacteriales bacterium]